jgi:hypothetical protein
MQAAFPGLCRHTQDTQTHRQGIGISSDFSRKTALHSPCLEQATVRRKVCRNARARSQ